LPFLLDYHIMEENSMEKKNNKTGKKEKEV
jgi:hypothetical protein